MRGVKWNGETFPDVGTQKARIQGKRQLALQNEGGCGSASVFLTSSCIMNYTEAMYSRLLPSHAKSTFTQLNKFWTSLPFFSSPLTRIGFTDFTRSMDIILDTRSLSPPPSPRRSISKYHQLQISPHTSAHIPTPLPQPPAPALSLSN